MVQIDEVLKGIDTEYAYRFAKKLETYKCNPVLGYRTAGSRAEFETGNLIYDEMKQIGIDTVVKDEITLDSWEFQKAKLSFESSTGKRYEFELGAYQTQFHTYGPKKFSLVYLGKGKAVDYKGIDVRGKLVLVDINQRDEWWINYPVYQSYLKGAAALIAVQISGYGQIDEKTLNAQDIAGPSEAAAFSISQKDAECLKEILKYQPELEVILDAISLVKSNQKAYNIIGKIEGRYPESMILLSAHYDSYFSGFQDDNVAIAMMLGIARAVKQSGYRPNRTLVFGAMAAEEWGVINSKYDWSTGAYEELFSVHPEWKGKVIADINFELPAHAHDKKDRIRCVYEYAEFIKEWIKEIDVDQKAYPEGLEVVYPIETWSDDFSMAIFGIPSIVNDFSSGTFMATHYHSQFDNEVFYEEAVYKFHHRLYAALLIELDQTAVVPLNFKMLFNHMLKSLSGDGRVEGHKDSQKITHLLVQLEDASEYLYKKVQEINRQYKKALEYQEKQEAHKIFKKHRGLEKHMLKLFAKEQDALVRLNWHDEVYFPHEILKKNLKLIEEAIIALERRDIREALADIYQIDNNKYAFLFEKEVYEYFTDYVLMQSEDRLKWGKNRIVGHENLFDIVQSLEQKLRQENNNIIEEIKQLQKVQLRQQDLLNQVMGDEKAFLEEFLSEIQEILL